MRLQIWIVIVFFGVAQAAVLAWMLLEVNIVAPDAGSVLRKLLLLLVIVAGFLASVFVQSARWRRALRRAEQLRLRVCPYCLYELDGGEGKPWSRCPECGTVYTADTLRKAWSLTTTRSSNT